MDSNSPWLDWRDLLIVIAQLSKKNSFQRLDSPMKSRLSKKLLLIRLLFDMLLSRGETKFLPFFSWASIILESLTLLGCYIFELIRTVERCLISKTEFRIENVETSASSSWNFKFCYYCLTSPIDKCDEGYWFDPYGLVLDGSSQLINSQPKSQSFWTCSSKFNSSGWL